MCVYPQAGGCCANVNMVSTTTARNGGAEVDPVNTMMCIQVVIINSYTYSLLLSHIEVMAVTYDTPTTQENKNNQLIKMRSREEMTGKVKLKF